MAKSLRSKWRRKMRAEKRVKYGIKELDKLKKMLTEAGDYQMVPESQDPSTESIEPEKIPINAIPRPKSASSQARRERTSSRKSRLDEFEDEENNDDDVEMEEHNGPEDSMSVDKPARVFSKRTFKDQFGNYPVWMNKRKMMTQQKKNKRINRNRALSVAGKRKGGKRNR